MRIPKPLTEEACSGSHYKAVTDLELEAKSSNFQAKGIFPPLKVSLAVSLALYFLWKSGINIGF